MSDGSGVSSIAFSLRYHADPGMPDANALIGNSIELAPSLIGNAMLTTNPVAPGEIGITLTLNSGTLAAGPQQLVIVRAAVGIEAAYGSKQVLDIADIAINGAPGRRSR